MELEIHQIPPDITNTTKSILGLIPVMVMDSPLESASKSPNVFSHVLLDILSLHSNRKVSKKQFFGEGRFMRNLVSRLKKMDL